MGSEARIVVILKNGSTTYSGWVKEVGTSAVVHPAASLIPMAQQRIDSIKTRPATVIEFNLTQTEASRFADIGLYGPSGEILPRVVELTQSDRG